MYNQEYILESRAPKFTGKFYENDIFLLPDELIKSCYLYAIRAIDFINEKPDKVKKRYLNGKGELCKSASDLTAATLLTGNYYFFLRISWMTLFR